MPALLFLLLWVLRSQNVCIKRDDHVIAVIGDGALTGGMANEGLNNAGRYTRNCYKNFIVILNDNKMSISRDVAFRCRDDLTSIRNR